MDLEFFAIGGSHRVVAPDRAPDHNPKTAPDLPRTSDQAFAAAKCSGENTVAAESADRLPMPGDSPDNASAYEGGRRCSGETQRRPLTILVADDNAQIRQWCRVLLEDEGHQVIEVADGEQVIEEVTKAAPAIIIMAADMPRLNGLECAQRLKSDRRTRHILIIMSYALEREVEAIAGFPAVVDEYITKPFKSRDFVLRVRAMAKTHDTRLRLLHGHKRQRRQALIQRHLLEFLHAAATTRQLDDVLDHILRITAKLIRCRRVSIMLPDLRDGTLTIARAIGLDDHIIRHTRVPIGSGTAGRVFASGCAVIINSATSSSERLSRYDSEYFVSAPLVCKALATSNKVVGILNLTDREHRRPFGPGDLRCVDLICDISASAINEILATKAKERIYDSLVGALATLTEFRDDQTGKHVDRVTRYSLLLAQNLTGQAGFRDDVDSGFLRNLRRAVPLHDIGKIAIPDSILLKRGRLTAEEMSIMRGHAEIGERTIKSMMKDAPEVDFLPMAAEIAYGHHEWHDGTGYPRGIAGRAIPLSASIVAVADVYDAVTTKRVYKPAQSHHEARTIIKEASGTQFDPEIVEAFLRCEKEFKQTARKLADDTNGDRAHMRVDKENRRERISTS